MPIAVSTERRTRSHRGRPGSGHTPMSTYDFTDPISMMEFIDVEPGVHLHHRFADHLG